MQDNQLPHSTESLSLKIWPQLKENLLRSANYHKLKPSTLAKIILEKNIGNYLPK